MEEERALAVKAEDTIAPVMADEQLLLMAEQAERRINAIKKIKSVALRVTGPNDWVDQNGKPYLAVSGAEKVGRTFGISWRISPPEKRVADDSHFTYVYVGEFSLSGATIEAVGSRSSKDAFFSKKHGESVPVSEIDEANVQKAAYTNCIGNGVTRILGIRNLTWEEITEVTGISKDGVSKVEYKTKDKKQGSGTIPPCPVCGENAIIKGKEEYGGGFICFKKKGGCGTKWDSLEEIKPQEKEDAPEPTSQASEEIEEVLATKGQLSQLKDALVAAGYGTEEIRKKKIDALTNGKRVKDLTADDCKMIVQVLLEEEAQGGLITNE